MMKGPPNNKEMEFIEQSQNPVIKMNITKYTMDCGSILISAKYVSAVMFMCQLWNVYSYRTTYILADGTWQ